MVIGIQAKLKLGVCNDDAFGQRNRRRLGVQLHTDPANLLGQGLPNHLNGLGKGDVLVVLAHRRFGSRREDRLG